ncbi:MAG TPA: ABC transporter permease [Thermoanaerobaculia bacterium]|jgi:putative ABC transport system permease protein
MIPVRLAIRHVTSRKLRSALTVAAIGLSTGLVGFLYLVNGGLKNDWSENMGFRAMVMAKTSMFERLPMAYLAKLEDVPGVQRVCPFDFLMTQWKDDRPENAVPFQAAPADAFVEVYREAKIAPEQIKAWKDDPTGCVIGPILAKQHAWKIGDRIVLKAPVAGGTVETTVRAVMTYKLDNGLYVHRKYFENLTGDTGQVGMFWILAKSRADVPKVTAEIERRFENAPAPIRAMSEKQWQLMFMEMLGNVQALLGGIGLATAFTLFLITSNTLAMAARERRGEAALLRILGFPRQAVLRLLVLEGALFGAAGGIVGLGFMRLFAVLIEKALVDTQFAAIGALLNPDLEMTAAVLGLSFLVAVVASLIPAVNLSNRPVVSLAREGE